MGGLSTSTANASPLQLIARINAAGGIAGASEITTDQLLRLIQLLVLSLDDQGVDLPEELTTLLDSFDIEDDSSELPT